MLGSLAGPSAVPGAEVVKGGGTKRRVRCAAGVALAASMACGGGGSGSPNKPSDPTPVTQQYTLQNIDEKVLCNVAYTGTLNQGQTITGNDLKSKYPGVDFNENFFVVREPRSSSAPGRRLASTTSESPNDALTADPKVIYVIERSSGFDPVGVLDSGFGRTMPYGRDMSVSMMAPGTTFPKPDVEAYALSGYDGELQKAVDLNQ